MGAFCSAVAEGPPPVFADYHVEDEVLGEGTMGVVRRATAINEGEEPYSTYYPGDFYELVEESTRTTYAVKEVSVALLNKSQYAQVELEIASLLKHEHVCELLKTYQSPTHVYLVMELCTGGELYTRIQDVKDGPDSKQGPGGCFPEKDAAQVTRQMLEAISYCHSKGVVHRDLKPENFLLKSEDPEAALNVKLIDFGLSRFQTGDDQQQSTSVGSVYYMAPELITNKTYGRSSDVWAVGIITYVLLCGYPPFAFFNEQQTLKAISKGKVEFPDQDWKGVSSDIKLFVRKLLVRRPDSRIMAAEALETPWITNNAVEQPDPFKGVITRKA